VYSFDRWRDEIFQGRRLLRIDLNQVKQGRWEEREERTGGNELIWASVLITAVLKFTSTYLALPTFCPSASLCEILLGVHTCQDFTDHLDIENQLYLSIQCFFQVQNYIIILNIPFKLHTVGIQIHALNFPERMSFLYNLGCHLNSSWKSFILKHYIPLK
jgi:hypothetical protein